MLSNETLVGEELAVCGWINNFRVQKNNGISFISLNDGSCFEDLQIIVDPQNDEDLARLDNIYSRGTKGVSIKTGKLVKSPMCWSIS